MSLKLLGDCWIINMINWSWQTLLLKQLLFSSILQLKFKKCFRSNCEKKGNHNLHINISLIKCEANFTWLIHITVCLNSTQLLQQHNYTNNVKQLRQCKHPLRNITEWALTTLQLLHRMSTNHASVIKQNEQ